MNLNQRLLIALSAIFTALLAHSWQVDAEQASKLADYRHAFDSDGDLKLSQAEVAKWFAKRFGGVEGHNASDDHASLAKFGSLLAQFDTDKDGEFDDGELLRLFDSVDEWPSATKEEEALGGDAGEAGRYVLFGVGSAGLLVLALLFYSEWSTARAFAVQERKLKDVNKEVEESRRKREDALAERKQLALDLDLAKKGLADTLSTQNTAGRELKKKVAALESALVEKDSEVLSSRQAAEVAEASAREKAAEMGNALGGVDAHKQRLSKLLGFLQVDAHVGKGQFEKDGAQIGFGLESKGNLVFGSLEDGDLWLQEGQLGAGKTGAYKVTCLASGATRCMKSYGVSNPSHRKDLMTELRAKQCLSVHPSVMNFDKVIETESTVYVLMELLQGCDMIDHVVKNGPLSEEVAKTLFKQVLQGLAHLHAQGVLHGDVKPENIMVVRKSEEEGADVLAAKIIDFGGSTFPEEGSHGLTGGSVDTAPRYAPPEVKFRKGWDGPVGATEAIDMYRVGVTLYIALIGAAPWSVDQEKGPAWEMPQKQREAGNFFVKAYPTYDGGKQTAVWTGLSDECKALIEDLLSYNPDKRPGAEAVLGNPKGWFSSA